MTEYSCSSNEEDEIDLLELLKIVYRNKVFISIFTITITILTYLYLYFQPTTYEYYSIGNLNIKSKSYPSMPNDLFGVVNGLSSDDIDKEMSLYSTYSINKKVLDKLNLEVQYFQKKGFKLEEIYDKSAIKVSDINITHRSYFDKHFKVIPNSSDTFTLQIVDKGVFSTPIFSKIYRYNTPIKEKNFQFKIDKIFSYSKPYILKFNGTKRDIYENIIKNNLKITRVDKKGSMIKISYRDNIEKRAKKYINTLAKVIEYESIFKKNIENEKIINSIEKQLKDIRQRLDQSEGKMQEYKVDEDFIDPIKQKNILFNKISKIDDDIKDAKLKYFTVQDIKKKLKSKIDYTELSLSISELGDKKTSLLLSALENAEKKYRELNKKFTKNHPDLIDLNKEIKQLKRKIKNNINSLENSISKKIKKLKKMKLNIKEKIKLLPEKERKLVNFDRENEVNSKMYSYLLQQRSQRIIQRSSMESDFKLVDQVYIDNNSIKPKRDLVLVVAFITGLILSIFLVFVIEFFNDKIRDVATVEDITKFPIFGVIPKLTKKSRKLEVLTKPKSKISESFKVIKRYIVSSGLGNSGVILVTSMISGEGKTLLTVNLASVFSILGYKTVILSLDLKRPKIGEYFNINPEIGVSNYLQYKSSLSEIIQKTRHRNLDVIASGEIPMDTSELLLRDELGGLITYLREMYDYVIIDSPSLKGDYDAIDVINYVDRTLFVVRVDSSTKKDLKELEDIVEDNDLENISIVVNGANEKDINFKYRVKRNIKKINKNIQKPSPIIEEEMVTNN